MAKKILIVDDNLDLVALEQSRFEAHNWDVITASDGVEGLVQAKDHKPDLIILDVIMPNLDGYSLVRELKMDPETKTIPILILTNRDQLQDLFKQEGIQDEDYLVKPFDGNKLVEKIESKFACT